MRRIFIGDIHGCLGPLEELLAAVAFESGVDELYPVGDLVNKGPDSEGVLRLLRAEQARCVLGNHDIYWLRSGRVRDPGDRDWLQRQPIARVMSDIILIHAGLHPDWDEQRLAALSEAEIDYAVNIRYCDASGDPPPSDWPPPGPPYRPWHDLYQGAKTVVFGHWARQGLLRKPRLVGLDSGCVYGGPLSAWIAEEDRVVQVPGLNN